MLIKTIQQESLVKETECIIIERILITDIEQHNHQIG